MYAGRQTLSSRFQTTATNGRVVEVEYGRALSVQAASTGERVGEFEQSVRVSRPYPHDAKGSSLKRPPSRTDCGICNDSSAQSTVSPFYTSTVCSPADICNRCLTGLAVTVVEYTENLNFRISSHALVQVSVPLSALQLLDGSYRQHLDSEYDCSDTD